MEAAAAKATKDHEARVANMKAAATKTKEEHEAAMKKEAEEHKAVIAKATEEHSTVNTTMTEEHEAKVTDVEAAAARAKEAHKAASVELSAEHEDKMKNTRLRKDLEAETDANTAFAKELADVNITREEERAANSKTMAVLTKSLEDEGKATAQIA